MKSQVHRNIAIAWLLLAATTAWAAELGAVVQNFNSEHAVGREAGATSLRRTAEAAKVGAYGGTLAYALREPQPASVRLRVGWPLPTGAELLTFWLKGDGSPNVLRLHLARFKGARATRWSALVPELPLAAAEWQAQQVALSGVAQDGEHLELVDIEIVRKLPPDKGPAEGKAFLDDFVARGQLADAKAPLAVAITPCPGATADIDKRPDLLADVRNFAAAEQTFEVSYALYDAFEQEVQKGKETVLLPAGGNGELTWPLSPKAAAAPSPFRFRVDAHCARLRATASAERSFACGNARVLLEDFEQVKGRFYAFAAGKPFVGDFYLREGTRRPIGVALARSAEQPHSGKACARIEYGLPKGRHTLALQYNRDLEGHPYKVGLWVRNDGPPVNVSIATSDHCNRHYLLTSYNDRDDWDTPLGRVTEPGWQYLEAVLPSVGIGEDGSKAGGRGKLHWPLRITALNFTPDPSKEPTSGVIWVDDLTVFDQKGDTGFLTLALSYANDEHILAEKGTVRLRCSNSSLLRPRRVALSWEAKVKGRAKALKSGRSELELPPASTQWVEVDVADLWPERDTFGGPVAFAAQLADTDNVRETAQAEILLVSPDYRTVLYDFEEQEPFAVGGKAFGTTLIFPTAEQAHGGKRSLKIPWVAEQATPYHFPESALRFAEPPPGLPRTIGLWVHGDGGNEVFSLRTVDYGAPPHRGISTEVFPLQPVRVDWQGWRQVSFELPKTVPGYDDAENQFGVVNYPLRLDAVVYSDAQTTAERGAVFIDDLVVVTQLPRRESVAAGPVRPNCLAVFPPGQPLGMAMENRSLAFPRTVAASFTMKRMDGTVVAEARRDATLAPGARQTLSLDPGKGATGWFSITTEVTDKADAKGSWRREAPAILYAFPVGSHEALVRLFSSEVELRKLLRSTEVVDVLDWDSWESFKGLPSPHWFESRLGEWGKQGRGVNAIVGYSADWAAGEGYRAMREGSYRRWLGAGMQVPEEERDWEAYVRGISRYFRGRIPRWIVWHIPDRDGPLRVAPAKFGRMLDVACREVKRYNPKSQLLVGSLSLERGVPYLAAVLKASPQAKFDAVCLDLSMGNEPPEYGFLLEAVDAFRRLLKQAKVDARIVATYMDWQAGEGLQLSHHEQAMFLSRGLILAKVCGIEKPYLTLAHSEFEQRGAGLVYRKPLKIAGKSHYMVPKPAFLSYLITQNWMEAARYVGPCELREREPFFTRCYLFDAQDAAFAAIWRTLGEADLVLPQSLRPQAVRDAYGIAATPKAGEQEPVYRVGGMPLFFRFPREQLPLWQAELGGCRLRYRDAPESLWRQTILDSVIPGSAGSERAHEYKADGTPFTCKAPLVNGTLVTCAGRRGLRKEEFVLDLSQYRGGDLVLVKRLEVPKSGQVDMEVGLDGKAIAAWPVKSENPRLPGGLRDVSWIIERSALGGRGGKRRFAITYAEPGGTSFGCWLHESATATYYLSDLDPISAQQTYGVFKRDLNVVNRELKVLDHIFPKGLGTHAPARIEYLLNAQFTTFEAEVGVDAFGEGKGSVVFQAIADGELRYKSPAALTGFDPPQKVHVDVKGVRRLVLAVTDAGDGNEFDFADWGNARLSR